MLLDRGLTAHPQRTPTRTRSSNYPDLFIRTLIVDKEIASMIHAIPTGFPACLLGVEGTMSVMELSVLRRRSTRGFEAEGDNVASCS